MDNTAGSGYLGTGGGGGHISGFGYAVVVSIGIIFLITTITLASFFCSRTNHQQQNTQTNDDDDEDDQDNRNNTDIVIGIDEQTLLNYPKVLFSGLKDDSTVSCCSICLADYKCSDMLRLLPECGHVFHLQCVDHWLRLHPTCPVCRKTPSPSPSPSLPRRPFYEEDQSNFSIRPVLSCVDHWLRLHPTCPVCRKTPSPSPSPSPASTPLAGAATLPAVL